jgi:hypothetical protein
MDDGFRADNTSWYGILSGRVVHFTYKQMENEEGLVNNPSFLRITSIT